MEVIADKDLLKNNDHQTFETSEVEKKSFTKDEHKDNSSNKCIIKDIYESEEFTISSSKDKIPARIKFFKNYLNEEEANDLYASLVKDLDWQQKTGTNKEGNEYSEPRLTYWFGKAYKYSSVSWEENQQWHPKVEQLRDALCNDCNFPSDPEKPLNSVMCNYYRNNNDSIGWHSDDEVTLGRCPTIASISLGCTRVFEVVKRDEYYKRYGRPSTKFCTIMYRFHLGNGSLLVMDGSVQDDWLHQVPKVDDKMDGRINLTFRHIVNEEEEKKEIERKKKLARERKNNESKQRQLENRRYDNGRRQDQYDYYSHGEYEYNIRYRKYCEELMRYENQYKWSHSSRYDSEPEQNYHQNDYNYEQGYNRKNFRRREDLDHNKPYRRKNSEGNDHFNGREIEESMNRMQINDRRQKNWEEEKYPENRNDNDHREFLGRKNYKDDNNRKGFRRGDSNKAGINDEGEEQHRYSNHGYSKEIGNVEERAKGFGDNEPQRGNIDGRPRGSRHNYGNKNSKDCENKEEAEFVNNTQHRPFSDRKGRGSSYGNINNEENYEVKNAQYRNYGGRSWRDDSRYNYNSEDALLFEEEEERRRRPNDNRPRGGGNRNARGPRLNYSNSETMPYEDQDKEQFRGNKQNRGDVGRNRNRPRSSYNPDRQDQENQDFDSNRNSKRGADQRFKGPCSDYRNKDSTYGEEQEEQKGRDRNIGSQSNYRERNSGGYKQQRYNSESNRSRGRGSSGISFHDNRDEVAFVNCNERMFGYHKDPDEGNDSQSDFDRNKLGDQQQEERH